MASTNALRGLVLQKVNPGPQPLASFEGGPEADITKEMLARTIRTAGHVGCRVRLRWLLR